MGNGDWVIGYARVSTEEQGMNGAGLEAQRAAIRAECERRGWELARIHEDVLSGKTINRPGLRDALDACRSGEVSGIVVAKLDRLTRSVVDLGRLLEEAKRGGWNVAALDFGLDLSTPQGELVANVLASVAQWERRIIGQRTKEALAVKKAQGVRVGRPRQVPTEIAAQIRRARARGRRMPLSAEMVAFLRELKVASRFSQDDHPVFASKTGQPLTHRNATGRGFESAINEAGIEGVSFHSMRHAFASRMIARGISSTVLAKLMGHESSAITERRYIHLFDQQRTDEQVRLAMASATR